MSSAAGNKPTRGSDVDRTPKSVGDSVSDYYQRNTGIFLRLGGGKSTGSIHRPLWAEGVTSVEQALVYAYKLVAAEARNINLSSSSLDQGSRMHILDLGCGVGGAACYLASELGQDVNVSGVTLSTEQARRAQAEAQERGIVDRCVFMVADFLDLPEMTPVDLAFSIEAFVQAANPEGFFREAARVIKPGGRLVIIDDMLREGIQATEGTDGNGRRTPAHSDRVLLNRFIEGWHAASFSSRSKVRSTAETCGFRTIRDENLSPLLRLNRLRDKFIRWCIAPFGRLIRRHPYGRSLIGGNALRQGLRRGLIEYRLLVLEKST